MTQLYQEIQRLEEDYCSLEGKYEDLDNKYRQAQEELEMLSEEHTEFYVFIHEHFPQAIQAWEVRGRMEKAT